jgi:hypothetical protein
VDEVEPFHVEIGYWYWDAEHDLVMRGLLTPRGIAVLAGVTAKPDDTIIRVAAESEPDTFGILSNPYLLNTARTTRFEVTLDLSEPNRYTHDQKTYMLHARLGGSYCHQDRNTLTLVSRSPELGQTTRSPLARRRWDWVAIHIHPENVSHGSRTTIRPLCGSPFERRDLADGLESAALTRGPLPDYEARSVGQT